VDRPFQVSAVILPPLCWRCLSVVWSPCWTYLLNEETEQAGDTSDQLSWLRHIVRCTYVWPHVPYRQNLTLKSMQIC